MKRSAIKKSLAVLTSAVTIVSMCPASAYAAMDTSEFPSGYSYSTEMRGLTAFQITNDMGAGWNLGNSLESAENETKWGNPKTTKRMIDAIAAKGFTTLRVPVRWDDHYSNASTYTIDSSYMDRVETVVNYGLANDMYVILNVHHNDLQHNVPNTSAISEELSAIWTQVGNRFKNYGDKLIFEVNNEPRSGDDWTGNSNYYNSVNQSNEAARKAIRATGGNNTSRLVMLPTYCASGDAAKAAAWTKNSSDNMIAASIHAYLPFDFAFNGEGHTNWLTSDETELQSFFDRMEDYFIDKGVPVVIGEFGNTNKNNTSARVQCADTYVSLARQFAEQDIPCVVWDNNGYNVGAENFGLFNRDNCTFTYGDIASAIVNAYNGDPDYSTGTKSETVISDKTTTSTGWGQALQFDGGIVSGMSAGESIYVNYSSSSAPEMILQDTTTGSSKGWVKVNPDSASNGVAVWSYNTLLNAFGGNFTGLTWAYVGGMGVNLTVTKAYVSNPNAHTHNYNGAETVSLAATATTKGRKKVACSVSGCSEYKVVVTPCQSNVSETPTGVAPAKPTGVKVVSGGNIATISWDKINGATSYRVYRSTSPTGTRERIAIRTSTYYIDKTVNPNTTYYYWVQSYNTNVGLTSDYSDRVSVNIVSTFNTKPVLNTAKVSSTKVTLSWNIVPGATSYHIFRRNAAGTRVLLKTQSMTEFTDTGLTKGQTYKYEVRAYSAKLQTGSDFSVLKSAKPMASPTITGGNANCKITWDKNLYATSYRVYRSTSSTGAKTLLKAVGGTTLTYTDTTAVSGKTYYYWVAAYDNATGSLTIYSAPKIIKKN